MFKMIADLTKDATVRVLLIRLNSPALPDQIAPSGPGIWATSSEL